MKSLTMLYGSRYTYRALLSTLLISVSTVLLLGLSTAVPAQAIPGGTPWIVSLGDSSISGEAGRWAGNTREFYSIIDALGPTAYDDNGGQSELVPGCHRSQSAEVNLPGGKVFGKNFACSGAQTLSTLSPTSFKPGIDIGIPPHEGQTAMLQGFAETHDVRLVVVAIGANNFGYSSIIEECVKDFNSFGVGPCNGTPFVTGHFTPANVATQKTEVTNAILRIAEAMKNDHYSTTQYTILVQDYASLLPNKSEIRYGETIAERQTEGGCGLWGADLTAGNELLAKINNIEFEAAYATGLTNLNTLEVYPAFKGRRLCEKGVSQLPDGSLLSWKELGAVNETEWVNMIRTPSIAPLVSLPYELQEDLHANYWGQLALRDCLAEAYNAGTPIGGVCKFERDGLNSNGEPNMELEPDE